MSKPIKVKLKSTGKELHINKTRYHTNPDLYEVLDGEVGSVEVKQFTPPAAPKAKLVTSEDDELKNKMDDGDSKTSKAPAAPKAPAAKK